MNKITKSILAVLLLFSTNTFAQKKKSQAGISSKNIETVNILLKPEKWEFKPQTVEFIEYKSRPALKILSRFDAVVLKDFCFSDGTIEYDLEPLDPNFTSIYFRWKDSNENECFYFRTGRAGNPQSVDAIQYAPIIGGVNLWDLLPQYQTCADFKNEIWNHVKLVISGKQMLVYINDMTMPALEIPRLEGNISSGKLAFDGQVIISNLIVKQNVTEWLSPEAGIDYTASDPRYLRKWQVSEPIITAKGIDFSDEYKVKTDSKWEEIKAERYGLVNLTRKFGKTEGRRIVWLKTTIHSDKVQDKMLRFGFSDELWVMINNAPLYIDKNLYGTPMAKHPDARCSIENTTIKIPLNKGENQLLIGVGNFFYGWGIVARFDDLEGIWFEK